MPSDSKDTGEKPWPELQFQRIARANDGYNFSLLSAATAQHYRESPNWETERYLPLQVIRERLLSDKAVGAVARERFDYLSGYGGPRWEEAHESIRRLEEGKAHMFLKAALDAAFSKEEGSDADA